MADIMEEAIRAMMQEKAAFNAEFGGEINLAIPKYEDPTRYPVEELIELFKFQQKFSMSLPEAERAALKAEFARKRDAIRLLPGAPERVYLWKENNIPAESDYQDNSGHAFDHEPDFKPYYLEMLLPAEREPIGGIVLVAGGTHGAGSINECYQVGLEFNALGYQCFILQCRPNQCPWTRRETAADAARAFQLIRANKVYRLQADRLAFAGFSNGGVTGDAVIEFYSEGQPVRDYFPDYVPDELDGIFGAPNAYLAVYGVRHAGTELSRAHFAYPPTFLAVGRQDEQCIENMKEFLPWAWEQGTPVEIHTFAGHPHGYAGWKINNGTGDYNFDLWVTHADVFLRDLFVGYDPKLEL